MNIGKYSKTGTSAYYTVDKYGFMANARGNLGDIIGRTFRAFLAYRDINMITAINPCWSIFPKYCIGIRHPEFPEKPMSRDHYIYTLCALKESNIWWAKHKIYLICKYIPWRVANMHRFTLSLLFWSKAINGSRLAELCYYIIEILTARLYYVPLFKLGYFLASYGEEVHQDDWKTLYIQNDPKWKYWINRWIYPAFAMLYSGFQIRALGDNFPRLKKALKKSYAPMVGKTNYVQRILFDLPVTKAQVESYKPMIGGRWSGNLNKRNDRFLYTPKDTWEYNNIDKDLLIFLYNESTTN